MWVVNVILIFAAIAFMSWLLLNYREEIGKALGVLFSGGQSVLIAIGVILREALKAAIAGAIIGGAFYLIFYLAGAPKPTSQSVAFSVASLVFTLLMLKALWDNLNNLRWSIRHEIRNRYRKR